MASVGNERIVVLIDMDCFFCQVETKLQPEYAGKPLAVVQYNQWKLGGIIAVNYEAREYGVTRHMRGEEAKEKCPDLVLASVPCLRGKADTSRYRSAGRKVIEVITKHCNIIERASVDEAYLDITDIVNKRMSANTISPTDLLTHLSNTFVVGHSEVGKNDEEERSKGTECWISNIFEELEDIQAQKLAVAGVIVEELRDDIFEKTGYKCSAGISQNKILAKLACGLHKPNRQTILPANAIMSLYSTLPVKKVRNLGGKFGDVVVESLNCNVMGDLLQYSLQYLQKRFDDKTGLWLYNIARGMDNEPVTTRLVTKSIGACKKFPGRQAITTLDVLKHWAGELSAEVCERLEQDREENERRATLLTICFHYYQNKTTISQSRSCTLTSYKPEVVACRCVDIICKSTQCPVAYLGISAGKFVYAKGSENFKNFFKTNKSNNTNEKLDNQCQNTRMEFTDSFKDVKDTIINSLKHNEITDLLCDSNEGESTSENKDILQDARNTSTPNTNTDFSPTSRRVSSLMNSLSELNKKKTFYEKKIKNSNFTQSLHEEEFKESFFMNIFNTKESSSKETEIIECDNRDNAGIECEDSNDNDISKDISENNSILSDEKLNTDDKNCNYKTNDSRKRYSGDNLDLIAEQCSSKVFISNDTVKKRTSSNVTTIENENVTSVQSDIKLEEIFPDLSSIDPSIVALLPLNLQEEAKMHMKAQSKKTTTKGAVVKNSKTKSKSKASCSKERKGMDMYSFLVKKQSRDVAEVPSMQCPQCYQMIPVIRYDEHCDFHVADNLQKEWNDTTLQNVNVERKVNAF